MASGKLEARLAKAIADPNHPKERKERYRAKVRVLDCLDRMEALELIQVLEAQAPIQPHRNRFALLASVTSVVFGRHT